MSGNNHKRCNCVAEPSDELLLSEQAYANINLAIDWLNKGRIDAAEVHAAAAKKLLVLSGEAAVSLIWARYYHARMGIAQKRGQNKVMLKHGRKYYALIKALHQADSYQVYLALVNLAECLVSNGDTRGLELMSYALTKLKAAEIDGDLIEWRADAVKQINDNLTKLGS